MTNAKEEPEVARRQLDLAVREVCGLEHAPDCADRVMERLETEHAAAAPGSANAGRGRPSGWASVCAAAAVILVGLAFWLSQRADDPAADASPDDFVRTGQDKRPPSPGDSTEVIGGRCVDAAGKPMANVKVEVYARDGRQDRDRLAASGLSGADGTFRFPGLPRIDPDDFGYSYYFLVAYAKGHAIGCAKLRQRGIDFASLTVTLRQPKPVTGVVRDRGGKPVADATVWLWIVGDPMVAEVDSLLLGRPYPLLRTRSDAKGRFELPGLPVGRPLRIRAVSPRHASHGIECRAGDAVEFELRRGGRVTGRVEFPDGKPAKFVRVCCQGVKFSDWGSVRTDAQGRFVVHSLRQDAYNIWAQRAGWTVRAVASLQIEPGGETALPAPLRLIRGGFIEGKVLDKKGAPVRPRDGMEVGIYGPSRPRSGGAIDTARVQPDGTFRIRVAPGRNFIYIPSAGSTSGAHVQVRAGGSVRVTLVYSGPARGPR